MSPLRCLSAPSGFIPAPSPPLQLLPGAAGKQFLLLVTLLPGKGWDLLRRNTVMMMMEKVQGSGARWDG